MQRKCKLCLDEGQRVSKPSDRLTESYNRLGVVQFFLPLLCFLVPTFFWCCLLLFSLRSFSQKNGNLRLWYQDLHFRILFLIIKNFWQSFFFHTLFASRGSSRKQPFYYFGQMTCMCTSHLQTPPAGGIYRARLVWLDEGYDFK